jgi:NADH-quinone oxidoreductase subunit H
MATIVFLGGWMPFHFGSWEGFNNVMDFIPGLVWFFMKVFGIIFLIMWFKWTFPRLRIDQILTLEWKYLLPINLFNILLMATMVLLGWHW